MDPASFGPQFYDHLSIREGGGRTQGASFAVPGNYICPPFGIPLVGYGGVLAWHHAYGSSYLHHHQSNIIGGGGDGFFIGAGPPPPCFYRGRHLYYPPPPPPLPPAVLMQAARSRFHPPAGVEAQPRRHPGGQGGVTTPVLLPNYLTMLPAEDGVAIMDLSTYRTGDTSETGDDHQIGHKSSSGLSEEAISNGLKSYYDEKGETMDEDCCVICQEEYRNGEHIGFLDCRHQYHVDCLKKWLLLNNVCPLCKAPAIK